MNKVIFLLDDSKFIRTVLRKPLSAAGYEVRDFSSPEEALAAVAESRPDLIITDLKMPTIENGMVFLEKLQASSANIPTMVYTSDNDRDVEMAALRMGVKSFVKKPIAPPKLLMRIRNLIGGAE